MPFLRPGFDLITGTSDSGLKTNFLFFSSLIGFSFFGSGCGMYFGFLSSSAFLGLPLGLLISSTSSSEVLLIKQLVKAQPMV